MTTNSNPKIIILAGATGGLGGRIVRALIRRGDEHHVCQRSLGLRLGGNGAGGVCGVVCGDLKSSGWCTNEGLLVFRLSLRFSAWRSGGIRSTDVQLYTNV